MDLSRKNVDHDALFWLMKIIDISDQITQVSREKGLTIIDEARRSEDVLEFARNNYDNLKNILQKGLFKNTIFSLLLEVNPVDAKKFLVDWYLREDLHYDNFVIGYKGMLQEYFEAIVDVCGAEELRLLLRSNGIDKKKLNDYRMHQAIMSCVDELETTTDVKKWLGIGKFFQNLESE
ncbi:hypothetical protein V8J88_05415 [Massilia sp. W12]|uniref:hypothetical protein n=1 Tax=Massilia sp. W12 TaxID=3126507 RepID=UPI0030D409AD